MARFLNVSRTYFDAEFPEDLARKLGDLPDEQLTTPAPSVAIPAMQGLSYSTEEPDLKEVYLSPLATATDSRVAADAHPSFAEIIKQLSPAEASMLMDVLREDVLPVVRLMRKADDGGGESMGRNHVLETVDIRGSSQ